MHFLCLLIFAIRTIAFFLGVNQDGAVNRANDLILLHPNKSTFLIEDSFGTEFLRASYINPRVHERSRCGGGRLRVFLN
jgi:hypothetical protein